MNIVEQKNYNSKERLEIYNKINNGSIPEDTTIAEQPSKITLPLKVHQLFSLKKAIELENENDNFGLGILCDPVGAGKSMELLSIIATGKNITVNNNNTKLIERYQFKKYLPINVLVVPHAIFGQWKDYITLNTTIKCLMINNTKFIKPDTYKDYELILITATLYKKFCIYFNKDEEDPMFIERLIFDESDSINIPNVEKIWAKFYWFVSSSITNLYYPYKTKDIINTEGISHSGFIDETFKNLSLNKSFDGYKYFIRNSKETIEMSFKLPEYIINIIQCKNPISLQIVGNLVKQDIIELINAGDITTAISKLGCEVSTTDTIISTVIKKLEYEILDKKADIQDIENKTFDEKDEEKNIKIREKKIKEVEKKIDEIQSKITDIKNRILENNCCCICYDEPPVNPVIVKCCSQKYCLTCITTWLSKKNSCGICRSKLGHNDFIVIKEDQQEKEQKEQQKEQQDKPEEFMKLMNTLLTDKNKKIMIFSEYENTFTIVKNLLQNNKINYEQIKGTGYHITHIIDKFKKGELQVLLLNASFFGAGLNLEMTTDLIFYHRMKKDLEIQVIGRAQRLGRETPLNIWKINYPNEIV
jgi:hypothetical protein